MTDAHDPDAKPEQPQQPGAGQPPSSDAPRYGQTPEDVHGSQAGSPYANPGPTTGGPGQPPGAPGQPYGAPGQQPFGAPGQQPYGTASPPFSEATDRQVGMFSHLGNILSVLAPLIIWLVTKDRGPLANSEGKEATNFGITVAIANVALAILSFVPILNWLTLLAFPALYIATIVFAVIAGMQVYNTGRPYRYPVTFRFVS